MLLKWIEADNGFERQMTIISLLSGFREQAAGRRERDRDSELLSPYNALMLRYKVHPIDTAY